MLRFCQNVHDINQRASRVPKEKEMVSELFAFQANCADELSDESLRNTVTAVAATEPFSVLIYRGETAEAAQGVARMFQLLSDAAAYCRSERDLRLLLEEVDLVGRRAKERMEAALRSAKPHALPAQKLH